MDPSSLSLHTAALFVCLFDDFVEPFEAKAALLFYIEVLFSSKTFPKKYYSSYYIESYDTCMEH